MLVSYKMPSNTLASNINIKVNSTSIDPNNFSVKSHDYSSTSGEGLLTVFISPINIGTHTLNVEINGTSANRSFTRLGGIVDEDNDGIDDRTDLPVGDGHVTPVDDQSVWDTMGNALKNSGEMFSGLTKLYGIMFSWLPSDIRGIVLLAMVLTFILVLRKLALGK